MRLYFIYFFFKTASGGGDKAVRFWNVITSMPQHTCLGHTHHVLCTTWSPDGNSFVSADRLICFFLLFSLSSSLFFCAIFFFLLLLFFSIIYPFFPSFFFFFLTVPFFSFYFLIFVSVFVFCRSGEIRVWDPKTGIQKGQPMRGHKKWVRMIFIRKILIFTLTSRIKLLFQILVEK